MVGEKQAKQAAMLVRMTAASCLAFASLGGIAGAASDDAARHASSIAAQQDTDFSSENNNKRPPQRAVPRGPAPRFVAPHGARPAYVGPRGPRPAFAAPGGARPAFVGPGGATPHFAMPVPSAVGGARLGYHGPQIAGARGSVFIGGRSVGFVRGPRTVFWHGGPHSLVGLTVLSAIVIGGATLYPYGYVPIDAPYCAGYTPDGCQLQWQDVPTVDGFVVPQCVAFCPYQ